MSVLKRHTRETRVELSLELGAEVDPQQIRTGDAFLDHMLITVARYGSLGLAVSAAGDLRHHLIEDVAITLGLALRAETPATCARYGHAVVPMDDALVQVAVDLGGRPYYGGEVRSTLYDHFFRSFADNAAMTLHIVVQRGRDRHHIVEAAMKALGLAVSQALTDQERVFSTKGVVRIDREED